MQMLKRARRAAKDNRGSGRRSGDGQELGSIDNYMLATVPRASDEIDCVVAPEPTIHQPGVFDSLLHSVPCANG